MASRGKPAEARRPAPRLYLVTPQAADPDGLREALAGALAAADIAAVLLRLPAADDRTLINRVKGLASTVQDKGAALVLDGHAEIVDKLNGEMKRIMAAPEIQQKIMNIGLIPHESPSVEGIQRYIKSETEKWGTLVRQLGLEGSQ